MVITMQMMNINDQQTMSSREIAELTGKQHAHVKRDIEMMCQDLGVHYPNLESEYKAGNGQTYTEYCLDRYHTEVLVTGYDVKRRAAVIKRWYDLESGKAQPAATPVTVMQKAVSDMREWKDAAALFGVPEAVAMVEGVKHVERAHDVDFKPLLLASPMMDNIKDDEVMLEPSEIGKRIGYSGKEVNIALCKAGLQTKDGGEWTPTEAAHGYTSRHFWMSKHSGKSGYNYKWNLEFVRHQLGK